MAFDSGGFFNSSSENKTENTSSNAGFSDVSGNITSLNGLRFSGKSKNNTVQLLDQGAINKSFSFAADISNKAFTSIESLTARNTNTVKDALEKVSESARTETENILISLQKYALYAFLLWGGVQVVRALKS